MFLFMAFGAAHIANLPSASSETSSGEAFISTANLMFVATTFGLALLVNVWVFFRVSGALFNPAISLALALTGIITPMRAGLFTVAQILGGITSAALIEALTSGPLNVNNRLSNDVSIAQGQDFVGYLICRFIHRNVFDSTTGPLRIHARCGETQGHFSGPYRDWVDLVCGSFGWSVLYWMRSEPRQELWA